MEKLFRLMWGCKKNAHLRKIWMTMKLTLVLFFLTIIQLMANETYSQSTRISLHLKDAAVKEVLNQIEENSEFRFLYNSKLVNVDRTVNAEFNNQKIAEVLEILFQKTDVAYTIVDRQIVLTNKADQTNFSGLNVQPGQAVAGKVTDSSGAPLPGVTVAVKGKTIGSITDAGGHYSLTGIPENATLQFSFVGMKMQYIIVGNRTTINVVMEEETVGIEEVVAIGYGTAKRKDLTGSVGSVKSAELMQRPATTITQSLAGKIAGVNVSTNSGRPGGNPIIRIRGYSSIQATNEPLYIVDGISSSINSLNPDDIESIDVLKDASSTAIYGTRGSNGVIVVTTKRGKNEARVNYNTYLSINQLARKLDVLNSSEFLYIEEQAYVNAQKFDPVGFASGKYLDPIVKRKRYIEGNTFGNHELFTLDANGVPQPIYDVDWQDMVTRNSFSQIHNLSYTGSYDKTNFGFFLGYTDDEGIIKESNLKRYSARATIDREMSKWLKVGGTLSYSLTNERRIDTRQGYNNVPRMMIEMVPFIPYKYKDGVYGYRGDYLGLEGGDNPLSQIYENVTPYNSDVFNGNTYAKITILNGLDFTSTFGANRVMNMEPYFNSTKSDIVNGLGGNQASVNNSQSTQWQWSNIVNYAKRINEDHFITLLLGAEYQKYSYFQSMAVIDKLSDDYYQWYNLGAGATLKAPSSSYNADQMESYFARMNYNYQEKYLLTLTGRIDGSSKFGANNKYAFFPSAALGWRVSQEGFLKENKTISNLKLRASYGFTGNSGIGAYNSMARLSTNAFPLGGIRQSGVGVGTLANPLLRWEKTGQFDIGFDLGLNSERFSFIVDYYIKNTTDLLMSAPVPSSSGYTSMTRNIGSMQNRGFEFTFNSENIHAGKFSWITSFNISTLKNKITALGVKNEDIIMSPNSTNILRVGNSVGSMFGYVFDGIWGVDQATEAATFGKKPGDARIKDINPDGKINESDRTIIGKGVPDLYGTLSNSFKYGNLDLLVELQYTYGNDVLMDHLGTAEMRQGLGNSLSTVLNAWTPDNTNSTLEQWRPVAAGYSSLKDTRRIKDGSFIRGKNISLGYNFTQNDCEKLKIKSLRLSLSAQNLFLITKYPGYDPEVTTYSDPFAQGIVFADYPKAKIFTFGLNVSF